MENKVIILILISNTTNILLLILESISVFSLFFILIKICKKL